MVGGGGAGIPHGAAFKGGIDGKEIVLHHATLEEAA